MDPSYDVTYGDAVVGQVQVEKQGLYYCMECSVKIFGAAKYRLVAYAGSQVVDLGLCIPQAGKLHLLTRIPAKRFVDEHIRFELLDKEKNKIAEFVPIHAGEPFAYLQRLEKSTLEIRGSILGAVLQD